MLPESCFSFEESERGTKENICDPRTLEVPGLSWGLSKPATSRHKAFGLLDKHYLLQHHQKQKICLFSAD